MKVSRRRIVAATGTAAVLGLGGCSTFTEDAQLLVIENETDDPHEVEIVVNRAPGGTVTETTTGEGTSTRFVVDFSFEVGADGRKQLEQVLPKDGTFEVIGRAPDLETGKGSYTDTESVHVTLADDGIEVSSFTPE